MIEFQEFYPQVEEEGFGRIFWSPIFEDVVESLLLCYNSQVVFNQYKWMTN